MKTVKIEVSDEALELIRKQVFDEDQTTDPGVDPLASGKWFIRTVTYHLVGRVVRRVGEFYVLKDAAWVADSGRFMQAIKDGALSEVEPVGDAIVALASIVDAFPWKHDLPKTQK